MALKDWDLVIVGGGPAGLSAGIYGARARLRTLIVEKLACGGQAATTHRIGNYPGFARGITGPELMEQMEKQAQSLGVQVHYAEAKDLRSESSGHVLLTDGEEIKGKALIIATGTTPNALGVPGEDEFRGRGVSYCATCDGAFFRDKDVVVVGGGNSAAEGALFMTRFARKVYVVHRRDRLRATKILQEHLAAHSKIELLWNKVVKEIQGGAFVERILLADTKGGPDLAIDASGVFVYIGNSPNSGWLRSHLELDERGYIITDERMQTSLPGVFAAGDVRRTPLRQVVTAVADGAVAAVEADSFLGGIV
ncbi:MAG: thioredoxin-disulfide reductase [Limnochordia bacterium]|jgi:thioredoxin reductase (NADPH)